MSTVPFSRLLEQIPDQIGPENHTHSLSSAGVPWGFSRGNGEQARAMDILEDWEREW